MRLIRQLLMLLTLVGISVQPVLAAPAGSYPNIQPTGYETITLSQGGTGTKSTTIQQVVRAVPRARGVPKLCFSGDSNFAFAINNSGIIIQNTTATLVNWLKWSSPGRFYTDQASNTALAGSTSAHWVNTQVPALISMGCQIVISDTGTNDIGVLTAATTNSNIATGAAALNLAGIPLVQIGIPPQGSWNSAKQQQADATNRASYFLSLNSLRNVRYFDPNPSFTDYGTGQPIAGNTFSDILHVSPVGGLAMVNGGLKAIIDGLTPPANDNDPVWSAAAYDATLSPAGSIMASLGLFAGTSGVTANGATGTVATGWNCYLSATSSMSLACSKGTETGNATIPTQVLTLSGTADTATVRLEPASSPSTPSGIVQGDKVYLSCRISWTGASNVRAVQIRMIANGSTSPSVTEGASFNPSGTTALAVPAAFSGKFVTEPVTVPAGSTSFRPLIEIVPLTSGSAAAIAVSASRCGMFKAGVGTVPGL